jgi:hypothetical protein
MLPFFLIVLTGGGLAAAGDNFERVIRPNPDDDGLVTARLRPTLPTSLNGGLVSTFLRPVGRIGPDFF